jgi:hypothetical protein
MHKCPPFLAAPISTVCNPCPISCYLACRHKSRPVIDTGALPVPEGVNKISFELKAVQVDGVTVFSPQEMAKLYEAQLGKKYPLDLVWELANLYHQNTVMRAIFYRAPLFPPRRLRMGLRYAEGGGRLHCNRRVGGGFKNRVAASSIVQSLIAELKQVRPLNSASIESYLLRLNDFTRAILSALIKPAEEADIISVCDRPGADPQPKRWQRRNACSGNSGITFFAAILANIRL